MAGHDIVIHLASNPDIARAATEPDIDFREGTFLTQQVVEAMRRTRHAAPALRLGQRRLRRSGRVRSPRGLRSAGPRLHLRREQAGRRSADRLLLRHVRSARPARSASATWWARGRRTASASISSAACGPAGSLAHPGRRHAEQVLHPRRGCGRRGAAGAREDAEELSRSTTSPPATTSPSPRSPTGHRVAGLLGRTSAPGVHRRRSRLEGRRTGGALEHGSHPRPGLDLHAATSRQALCVSMNSMLADARLGRL